MTIPSGKNQNLDQIKALLLGDEQRRLDNVETVALGVHEFVGDSARLEAATAEILVDALRKADIAQHQELASALAPAVIATLRDELKKSQEPPAAARKPASKAPLVLLGGLLVVAGTVWAATHRARPAAESDSRRQIVQLQSQLAETKSSLEELRKQADSAPAKLRRLVDNFAVFFTRDDALINPAAVQADLKELAGLLKSTGEKLRVVGYAEETGSVGTNRLASRRRAEKVIAMLVELGVPRENLTAVSRGRLVPIGDFSVGVPRNRRVVFERPYEGEFAIQ